MEAQAGPDPGAGNPGARLQWSTLSRVRARSVRVDAATGVLDVLGMLAAKARSIKHGTLHANCQLGNQASYACASRDMARPSICLSDLEQTLLLPGDTLVSSGLTPIVQMTNGFATCGRAVQQSPTQTAAEALTQVVACMAADAASNGAVPATLLMQALLGVILCAFCTRCPVASG